MTIAGTVLDKSWFVPVIVTPNKVYLPSAPSISSDITVGYSGLPDIKGKARVEFLCLLVARAQY